MKKEELARFVCRIINSSPSQTAARLALEQLESIREGELDSEGKKLVHASKKGLADAFSEMSKAALEPQASDEAILRAAERAERIRIQREMDARNGRC